MTSIIPEIDPRHPAKADPAKIVRAIQQEKVTNSFGSPTLWRKVAAYCAERKVELPTLRRVLCAGAPVPTDLWESSRSFLPSGRLHSPYGATEALPVSTVSAEDIDVRSTSGACVGRPVRGVEVRVIPISDQPISALAAESSLPSGSVGEIIVRGAVVTKSYATPSRRKGRAAAKIKDPSGGSWHRMGDCGKFDSEGRLRFLGRKAERVDTAGGTMYTEPCEQVFRTHPRARRCALVGLGSGPALVAETATHGESDATRLAAELRGLALAHPHTSAIRTFYFRTHLPVDVRHNAKIHRLALARWAAGAHAHRFE